MEDWKKKKMAVYIRRSEGEDGNTKKQLARIQKGLSELEKEGKIAKLNMGIVGRDINKKVRFKAGRDLKKVGDIFNEGDGQSGFKFEDRPVLIELLERMKNGEYEGIIVESMNRVARDFAGLSHLALPVWREEGKVILSLADNQILDDNRMNEAIINSQMTWGGINTLEAIKKGEEGRLGDAVDKGFLKGSKPEWLGSGTKGAGIDYRRAWKLMQAYGENKKGKLNSPGSISKEMGKTVYDSRTNEYVGDGKWASTWYAKMKGYDETGVLEDWLNAVEQMNQYILNQGEYPTRTFKNNEGWKNIKKSTTGFIAYPAGVNPGGTDEFVLFPNPLKVGLDMLASTSDPLEIETFKVVRKKIGSMKLHPSQTQPRSRKK